MQNAAGRFDGDILGFQETWRGSSLLRWSG